MIAVIDYGMGNLRSVEKAFQFLGFDASIVEKPSQAVAASHLVLPGDAAFGDAMRNVRAGGWDEVIHQGIKAGKPFLGICVGLQMMFGESEEMGQHEGLGLLPGKCVRFPSSERVPQIGWNQISIRRQDPLLEGVPDKSFFYFVHSYYVKTDYVKTDDVETEREDDCIATTDYGLDYLSIAGRDHVLGVQFHPEKSQQHGLRLLENFARMR